MARDSFASDLSKAVVGTGIGFALYLLSSSLAFGLSARGKGRDEGRGEGRGEVPAPQVPSPASPKDPTRLSFVMTQPLATEPFNPMTFLLRSEAGQERKTYSLGAMLARIKAGGRTDVELKIRGDVRTGSADEALTFLKKAGIEVWEEGALRSPRGPVPRVSGNSRGQYGW